MPISSIRYVPALTQCAAAERTQLLLSFWLQQTILFCQSQKTLLYTTASENTHVQPWRGKVHLPSLHCSAKLNCWLTRGRCLIESPQHYCWIAPTLKSCYGNLCGGWQQRRNISALSSPVSSPLSASDKQFHKLCGFLLYTLLLFNTPESPRSCLQVGE